MFRSTERNEDCSVTLVHSILYQKHLLKSPKDSLINSVGNAVTTFKESIEAEPILGYIECVVRYWTLLNVYTVLLKKWSKSFNE